MLPTFKNFVQYQLLRIQVYFLQQRINKWFKKNFTCIDGPPMGLKEYTEFAGKVTLNWCKGYNLKIFEDNIIATFRRYKFAARPYNIIVFRLKPEFNIGIALEITNKFSVSIYTRCWIIGLSKETYINDRMYFKGYCENL